MIATLTPTSNPTLHDTATYGRAAANLDLLFSLWTSAARTIETYIIHNWNITRPDDWQAACDKERQALADYEACAAFWKAETAGENICTKASAPSAIAPKIDRVEIDLAQYRNPRNLREAVYRQTYRPKGKPYPAVKREYVIDEPF
jgi:hypothetical protein